MKTNSIHLFTLMFLLLLSCSSTNKLFNPKLPRREIIDFTLVYDSTLSLVYTDSIPLGIIAKRNNYSVRKTLGFAKGYTYWNKYIIKTTHGFVKKGVLYFNLTDCLKGGKNILITVSPKNNISLQKEFAIPLPYLSSIDFDFSDTTTIATKSLTSIRLIAHFNSGEIITNDLKHELFDYIKVEIDNGIFHENEFYPLINLSSPYKQVSLSASADLFSTANSSITLPINYSEHYVFDFNGAKGIDGLHSTSKEYESYRFPHFHGKNGNPGSQGYPGKDVSVYIKTNIDNGDTLFSVLAYSPSIKEKAIISKPNGSITIQCNGGAGGSGGDGSDGSDGIGDTDSTDKVYAGKGGVGGNGGNGGNGGSVRIFCDSLGIQALSQIVIENKGGPGGKGGEGGNNGEEGYDHPATKIGAVFGLIGTLGRVVSLASKLNRATKGSNGLRGEPGKESDINILSSDSIATSISNY